MADVAFKLEHFIAMDKRYIRILLPIGLFLVASGLLGVFGTIRIAVHGSESDAINTITKALGALVTVIGLFPFNSCYVRWERIQTLRVIEHNPKALDYKSKHDLVCKLYAKFLGV
jgi:hypothetical protein